MVKVEHAHPLAWLKVGALIAAGFVLVCGAGYLVLGSAARLLPEGNLGRLEARAKELGIPLGAAEVETGVRPPASANAGPILLEMEKAMPASLAKLQELGKALSDRSIKGMRDALKDLEPLTAQAERAASMPELSFGYAWIEGPGMSKKGLEGLDTAALLLMARSLVRANGGSVDEALADLRRAQRLAELAGKTPSLPAALRAVRLYRRTIAFAADMAAILKDDAKALAKIDAHMAGQSIPDTLESLRGEAYFAVTIARNFEAMRSSLEGGKWPDPKTLKDSGMPETQDGRRRMRVALRTWIAVFEAAKEHPGDQFQVYGAAQEERLDLINTRSIGRARAREYIGSYQPMLESLETARAGKAVAAATIKVFAYHTKNGSWPETLNKAGADPRDPISERVLGYAAGGSRVKIWSVGVDRKDQGGLANGYLRFHKKIDPDDRRSGDIVEAFDIS